MQNPITFQSRFCQSRAARIMCTEAAQCLSAKDTVYIFQSTLRRNEALPTTTSAAGYLRCSRPTPRRPLELLRPPGHSLAYSRLCRVFKAWMCLVPCTKRNPTIVVHTQVSERSPKGHRFQTLDVLGAYVFAFPKFFGRPNQTKR